MKGKEEARGKFCRHTQVLLGSRGGEKRGRKRGDIFLLWAQEETFFSHMERNVKREERKT